jgi:ubiquitin-activating enzyme E1
MYKVHSPVPLDISQFRSGSANLALNMFCLAWPAEIPRIVCSANGRQFSLWDSWIFEGDLTVEQFIRQAREIYSIQIDMLNFGQGTVYANFLPNVQPRLSQKVMDIVNSQAPGHVKSDEFLIGLSANCRDLKGESTETPAFILKLK